MLPFLARRSWGVARRKESVTVLWAFWGGRRGGGKAGGPGFLVWTVGWMVGNAVVETRGGPKGQMQSSCSAVVGWVTVGRVSSTWRGISIWVWTRSQKV